MEINLNEMQQKIVMHTEGPVLVLAGAGSGKTRVLTNRIAEILKEEKARPHEILAITFTNKAAGEMRDRINKLGFHSEYIWAQTFHSFCARILRYEIDKIEGYNKNFSIYDEQDKKLVIKKILKSKEIDDDKMITTLMEDISSYKNQNMSLETFGQIYSYKPDIEDILSLMREYEEQMKNNNALDFDDLLYKTLNLFKNNSEVREKYQTQFKYILVDEFQDTNPVQYELVKILAQKNRNIFAVGDEDQSIYSWRGANVKNIKTFMSDFPDTTLYKLEQNYRSTKNIIECANKVIKHNENRIDKTLFTENETGVKVEYVNKYTDREEADYVAGQIYSLTHNFGYKYSDIAVLMRINALSRNFEDKMLSYDIPYQIFGGLKFYERAEIKNVLAYLKLLVNPYDNESFNRIVNFPRRNIGEVAVAKLGTVANGKSLLQTVFDFTEIDFQDKAFSKFLDFKTVMQDFINKKDELKVSELAEYIIDKLDLKTVYSTGKEEDENRVFNLYELIGSIRQFEFDNGDITLEEYLQNVCLTTDIDTYNEDNNNVVLATVHSAKGLEFKVVFIVGLEEQYFPLIRHDTVESDMEEERRLMYVAITRAMERLYLTNCSRRFLYGKENYPCPSRFLGEMEIITKKPYFEHRSFEDSYSNHRNFENSYSNKSTTSGNYKNRTCNNVSESRITKTENSYNDYSKSSESYNNSNDYYGYFGSSKKSYTYQKPLCYNFESKEEVKPTTIEQNAIQDYTVGEKVSHSKFGQGVVVEFQKATDILIVNFEGFGN
ncbi:MAG: UvrD-helicase domain-containing protein, partial [Clostridiales bacterium]|nr:UvrD-helicase domain-containing protein [Candidatus Apopatousia equi]